MKKYYTIEANPWEQTSEIRLGAIPKTIDSRAYLLDQWQYLDEEPEFIPYEQLGTVMPDIYTYNLPLVSAALKEVFDDAGVKNTFYKPIFLYNQAKEVSPYYLMLVEAVEGIIWQRSEHTVSEYSGMRKITGKFELAPDNFGNFKLVKPKDILNKFWLVDQELKEQIEAAGLRGIKILAPHEYYGL